MAQTLRRPGSAVPGLDTRLISILAGHVKDLEKQLDAARGALHDQICEATTVQVKGVRVRRELPRGAINAIADAAGYEREYIGKLRNSFLTPNAA